MAFDCLPLDRRITTMAYRTYSKEISLQKNRKNHFRSYSRKIDHKNGRLPLKSEALAGLHGISATLFPLPTFPHFPRFSHSGHAMLINIETSVCVTYSFSESRVVGNLYVTGDVTFHYDCTCLQRSIHTKCDQMTDD